MPKIIENLPERLVNEAYRQVKERGYSAMTIRSVARECGVGVGTVYNYYSSKEALVAAFMLEDWKRCTAEIAACAETAQGREPVLWAIYENLLDFMKRHEGILRDETAAVSFTGSFGKYHNLLRSQLAKPIEKFCSEPFTAVFIAEAMLTWTVAGKDFEELNRVLKRIF